MSMTGVLVNTGTILVGSAVGLLFKKGIPERVTNAVMIGLGLCTLYIGIDGALQDENVLIVIASMVLGAIVGTLLSRRVVQSTPAGLVVPQGEGAAK